MLDSSFIYQKLFWEHLTAELLQERKHMSNRTIYGN